MPYTPTVWTDEVPASTPVKYKITDDSDGIIANSAKIELVTSVTAGTALNAANFNKLEAAVEDAVTIAESAEVLVGKRVVELQVVGESIQVDTTSGVAYFFVPEAMDGKVLTRAIAMVHTSGTTNPTTVQVRNLTKYPSNDCLSTAISIASGATIGTAGTVNTTYDDVSTNDKIKVYVTGYSSTRPYGLWVVLEYSRAA